MNNNSFLISPRKRPRRKGRQMVGVPGWEPRSKYARRMASRRNRRQCRRDLAA